MTILTETTTKTTTKKKKIKLERFIDKFVQAHFYVDGRPLKLYDYQINIIKAILSKDSKYKRTTIRAATRAGKSYSLGIGAILYAIINNNTRIGIIGPTAPKTRPIMENILSFLANSEGIEDIVDLDSVGMKKIEKLKKEISKRKITLRNGSSIEILSADVKNKGFGAMGFGFDLTLVDETAEIPDETYNKIYRMLLENVKSKIVEIGNPWFLNHFYEHHYSPNWHAIHIPYNTCVDEGRFELPQIEDMRTEMSELEFVVQIEANFPKDIENSIFTHTGHIEPACRYYEAWRIKDRFEKILVGIDIARGGKDYTVITFVSEYKSNYYFLESKTMDTRDSMEIVGVVENMLLEHTRKGQIRHEIKIDCTGGMGTGLHDRLIEKGYNSLEFISGKKAHEAKYFNLKAECVYGLAKIMKDGRFFNLPIKSKYVIELKKWTFKIMSDRQVKVVDPEDKSPDYADSLMIAMSVLNSGTFVIFDTISNENNKIGQWR